LSGVENSRALQIFVGPWEIPRCTELSVRRVVRFSTGTARTHAELSMEVARVEVELLISTWPLTQATLMPYLV
jgi:hypothetical protein